MAKLLFLDYGEKAREEGHRKWLSSCSAGRVTERVCIQEIISGFGLRNTGGHKGQH